MSPVVVMYLTSRGVGPAWVGSVGGMGLELLGCC